MQKETFSVFYTQHGQDYRYNKTYIRRSNAGARANSLIEKGAKNVYMIASFPNGHRCTIHISNDEN